MMNKISKKILVVDDDEEIRDLLEFDISQSGYFVDTAKDGLEGLNKVLNNTYDLATNTVFEDLPNTKGLEFLKCTPVIKIKTIENIKPKR